MRLYPTEQVKRNYNPHSSMFLYAVGSPWTDIYQSIKLGMTIHPVQRMRTYNTGDAPYPELEKQFRGIWSVSAASTRDLRRMEAILHTHFASRRLMRHGRSTEWFTVTINEVAEFLATQAFVVRCLTLAEIGTIHKKASMPAAEEDHVSAHAVEEEKSLIEEATKEEPGLVEPTISLKERFFATFLRTGDKPRRIQSELWDLFETICERHDLGLFKGIVKWATGTGKTLAVLMMFVLSANKCKKQGRLFRGLLVAPTNDIFTTILPSICKLSEWGITICEGYDGHLSSLAIPLDRDILVLTTHASLTNKRLMDALPPMTHAHYDEVHRITGEEFYNNLNERLPVWNTEFLTGTSATPKTCNLTQHKKLSALFGDRIIHYCGIDEAIHEGWIASPRFSIHIVPKTRDREAIVEAFLHTLGQSVLGKQRAGGWRGGKAIAYLPTRDDVREAIVKAKAMLDKTWQFYTAVEGADAFDDDQFVKDDANGTVRILFACERYREGSDIPGLEMTHVLMGNSIAANILLQIAGRALRLDYAGKEGWCCIVKPCEDGVTEDEVFDSIVLYVMEFINATEQVLNKKETRRIVERFLGQMTVNGKLYDVDETTERIQAFYIRREFERGPPKEKYFLIRRLNQEMGLASREQYKARYADHPKYIEDPKAYFKDAWVSWYHFLGVSTVLFPQSKAEFIATCTSKNLHGKSWSHYKQNRSDDLPETPGQMYEDFTNWDREMAVEEEMIW